MRDASEVSTGYVAEFGRRLCEGTQRDLNVLSTIEETCGALTCYAEWLRGQVRDAASLIERINRRTAPTQLDPSGRAISSFEQSQDALSGTARELTKGREAAAADPSLHDDDAVLEAYDEAISAVRDFHTVLGELILALAEHDADRSPKTGSPVTSADELIAQLLQ
jgi:hypothetical protein